MKQANQQDTRLLQSITLRNLLSFGPDSGELELRNLNVLIGPNASGKSNLIEALALIRATPIFTSSNGDLRGVIRRGGGASEWMWKGRAAGEAASIDLVINYPKGQRALQHHLSFGADEQGFRLEVEQIEISPPLPEAVTPSIYYNGPGLPKLNESVKSYMMRRHPQLSILAQLRDPKRYPGIAYLADTYDAIRIYKEWAFGRNTVFREPQRADMRSDRLEEDFSNLGLFLSQLSRTPKAKAAILSGLKDLYEGVTDFLPIVQGGTVQVFFSEGDFSIPATRLSDGTLRYLCLLSILCDPNPPPLICIEEPELGLHPDILPKLADLLVSASERTQLIVTTHSDILVDAMTARPEAVIVCEKHDGKTRMHRLNGEDLADWLAKYRLGELWIRGGIGGTRS